MTYPSLCTTQTQALYAIQELHNEGTGLELDPMFNVGSMYGDGQLTPFPALKFDVKPLHDCVQFASADALPIESNTIRSMVLDPPWLIHSPGTKNKLATRYGHFKNKKELIDFMKGIINEAYRVLKQDGLLVFKCQDFIHNPKEILHEPVCYQLCFIDGLQSN